MPIASSYSFAITHIDQREDPCPGCGHSMVYPTSCLCTYERRVIALAGFGGYGSDWTDGWTEVDLRERSHLCRINAAMRALDESHLWPISNRYNVTERAIKRVRTIGRSDCVLEYIGAVDFEISAYVNA